MVVKKLVLKSWINSVFTSKWNSIGFARVENQFGLCIKLPPRHGVCYRQTPIVFIVKILVDNRNKSTRLAMKKLANPYNERY